MHTRSITFVTLAATLYVAALTIAAPAHAQVLYVGNGASYTANSTAYQSGAVLVGITSGGVRGAGTLNVVTGGDIGFAQGYGTSTTNISGGHVGDFATVDTSTATISGGTVQYAKGYNNSITTISGGSVQFVESTNTCLASIRGGSISSVKSYLNSTTNISGGTINLAIGYNSSVTNISGGTLINGLMLLDSTATVNFIGAGFSVTHQSYGASPYGSNADLFSVSSTGGGGAAFGGGGGTTPLYSLYIANTSGTANPTPRQFTINAVAVPEAETLALLLPALGVLGGTVVARRRK